MFSSGEKIIFYFKKNVCYPEGALFFLKATTGNEGALKNIMNTRKENGGFEKRCWWLHHIHERIPLVLLHQSMSPVSSWCYWIGLLMRAGFGCRVFRS